MHLANHDETATQRERPSARRLVQIQADNPYVALGLAVSHLMVGQINRKHYCFAMDDKNVVQGFLGWALTTEDKAEAWLAGRRGFVLRGQPTSLAASRISPAQLITTPWKATPPPTLSAGLAAATPSEADADGRARSQFDPALEAGSRGRACCITNRSASNSEGAQEENRLLVLGATWRDCPSCL